MSLMFPALAGGFFTTERPGKPLYSPLEGGNPPMASMAINTLMTQKCLSQPAVKGKIKKKKIYLLRL